MYAQKKRKWVGRGIVGGWHPLTPPSYAQLSEQHFPDYCAGKEMMMMDGLGAAMWKECSLRGGVVVTPS